MEKEIDYGSTNHGFRLEQLEPKVKRKALALAKGIMSVYGLNEGLAMEEGIKRAKEFYKKERGMEMRDRQIGAD